ncbi:MAG: phosphate butyryltransferase [Spirochaetia bacterium]|nr:phosphate butyryltransferase [Spirochaetia bacterium]MCE1208015.1 phosphate butyryltransferase [Spirochaetia bacterium]
MKNLHDLIGAARILGSRKVCVAAAEDGETIKAVRDAVSLGLVEGILVGDQAKITALCGVEGLPRGMSVEHAASCVDAAFKAVSIVKAGEADVLMKGLINTSDFLKAVLNPENGLRTDRLLSHLAAFEIPGEAKLIFHSDGGMNVLPRLEEKKAILKNALDALHRLGIENPNVAILAANEKVDPKIPSTVDAKAIVDAWKAGEFSRCVIEGPIAMDVATSEAAAGHKGIRSAIAGKTDLFIFPSIEAGNIAGKLLMRYGRAKMAGIIVGAVKPIVLVSRSDDSFAKIASIALACLASSRGIP